MRLQRLWFAASIALCLTPDLVAHAQTRTFVIPVALVIKDSATGGIFASRFRTALRQLPDIEVVDLGNSPKYVLSGIVTCNPASCQNTLSYNLALTLREPLDSGLVEVAVCTALPEAPCASRKQIVTKLMRDFGDYSMLHYSTLAVWGRDVYELAARELVAKIDSQCFEKARTTERIIRTATPANFADLYLREIVNAQWMC